MKKVSTSRTIIFVIIIFILTISSIAWYIKKLNNELQQEFNTPTHLGFSRAIDTLLATKIRIMAYKNVLHDERSKFQYHFFITSPIHSQEYPGYYYGFYIVRSVDYQNNVKWLCTAEYHPNKIITSLDDMINSKLFISYSIIINDEELWEWPQTITKRPKHEKKLIELLKKVQEETFFLYNKNTLAFL